MPGGIQLLGEPAEPGNALKQGADLRRSDLLLDIPSALLGRDDPYPKALSATLVSRPFSCPAARAARAVDAARAVEQV